MRSSRIFRCFSPSRSPPCRAHPVFTMSEFKRFGRTHEQRLVCGENSYLPLHSEGTNHGHIQSPGRSILIWSTGYHISLRLGKHLPPLPSCGRWEARGANQSIALAAAGAKICHIGAANPADEWLFNEMAHCGVDMTFVQESPAPTGHAIVSVNDEGENPIRSIRAPIVQLT